MEKPFSARYVAVVIELLRRNVLNNGQVLWSRAQILAHGEHFTTDLAQIVHGLKKFCFLLAKADHDPTLGHYFRGQFLCAS